MKSEIFIDPPPGFQGLDGFKNVERYDRNLPHWRQEGATYFVTFRLIDSLPQSKVNELKQMREAFRIQLKGMTALSKEDIEKRWQEFSKIAMAKTERWLDEGMGSCILQDAGNRKETAAALRYFEGDRCEVGAFVVMPNHVHALIRPLTGFKLERILQSIKRFSSRNMNRGMDQEGCLWQDESHDRIVRDCEHLWRCLQYIGSNPRKANLENGEELRWVSRTWREHGWDFVDAGDD